MTSPAPPAGSGGNVLTRKIGPLPAWAWTGIAAAILIGWALIARHQAAADDNSPATSSVTPPVIEQFQLTTPPEQAAPAAGTSVTVPNVIGQKYTAGAAKVTAAGFKARRGEKNVGTVTKETPNAGTRAKPGATITLSGKGTPKKKPAGGPKGGR